MESSDKKPKWILEPPADCMERESNIDCLNFLYRKGKFYIMDNHLAAGWCWLNSLDKQQEYGFIHIDQHNDLLNNNCMEPFKTILLDDRLELIDYTSLCLSEQKVFTWDNYILQIRKLLPEWFKDAKFSTQREPRKKDIEATFYSSAIDLLTNIKTVAPELSINYILNLDIDYFFDDNGERIASDNDICHLATEIKRLLPNIAVVTIALSPECCERDSDGWKNAIEAMSILDNELSIGFVEEFKSKIQL